MKLEKYDDMHYAEYMSARKKEKATISKRPPATEIENVQLEKTWKFLLGMEDSNANAFQLMHYHSYNPYPNPRLKDASAAAILVDQSHGRFLQMLDSSIKPGQDVMHLDLNSAYITALANVHHSLKFRYRINLESLNEVILKKDLKGRNIYTFIGDINRFRIIRLNVRMPYDFRINMFTPNTKIMFNKKVINESNRPNFGEMIDARVELFVGEKYNVDSLATWLHLFGHKNIEYKSVSIWVYSYKQREKMYDFKKVRELLEAMQHMDIEMKNATKRALVMFAGQLTNIDSGRRLLMLVSAEEVMRRLYLSLSKQTTVYGIQIDALYYEPFKARVNPAIEAFRIGKQVYGINDPEYKVKHFAKNELWTKNDYRVTFGRIQEVKKLK